MAESQEVKRLREKIAALEAENLELLSSGPGSSSTAGSAGSAANVSGAPRSSGRVRSAAAMILVVLSTLLAPLAVLGNWAHAELVDTDRFVQTFAPLAQKPEVQRFVAGEVSTGIKQNVDIDGMVGDLFAGIGGMNLPPRAEAVLPLLEGTAANGVRSLIDSGVAQLVESPQFAGAWELALRETHSRAIAVIQGSPGSALQLSDDGVLSLDLGAIITQVKDGLVGQGIGFAEMIPVVDHAIPLLASDSLVLVRTLYQLAVGVGFWLPWVALGALIAGVLVARNRTRTLAWGGIGIVASLLLLAAGTGVGKIFFIAAVSPSIMPTATADVVFVQLTGLIASTLIALIALFLFIAVGAWLSGTSRLARSIRGTLDSGFVAARRTLDARGLHTGAFGAGIDRWRPAILVIAVLISVGILFFMRPITAGGVAAVVLCLLGALCVVELLRRPAGPQAEAEAETEAAETVQQTASTTVASG